MEPSKTVYLRCSVKFTLNGQDRIDFDSLKGLVLINSLPRLQGLEAYIIPVNHVYQRFMNSKRLSIRACRLLSSGLLSIVPGKNRVFRLKKTLSDFFTKRRSTPSEHFKSLADNYERLVDIDILESDEERSIVFSIFGFELLKAKYSYATSVFFGYDRANAQQIIDVVYEMTDSFHSIPQIRGFCMEKLHNICGLHHLAPTEMQIELPEIPAYAPEYGGGFGDVFKYVYQGRELAVKVLKNHRNDDLQKITRRFYKEVIPWKFLRHPNLLSFIGVVKNSPGSVFAMVSDWMTNGDIRRYVRENPDVNRFKLLADVAKGLTYMHSQGVIHGDLKGDNILIDDDGSARLADFGLLCTPGSATSFEEGGDCRWMSPELIDPSSFGLDGIPRTRSSDCYALGMVVYEVLSGHVPFHYSGKYIAAIKVLNGERPERPQGVEGRWFTDEVWGVLGRCWKHEPSDRPNIDLVLECLSTCSDSWVPFSPVVGPQGGLPENYTRSLSSINEES